MAAPLPYVDVSRLVGSWPLLPAVGTFASQVITPGALDSRAVLIGVAREQSAGYDVGSKTFDLVLDGGAPVAIAFAAGNKTLAEVITQINTSVGSTVAFDDNKFLLIRSTTVGGASSVKTLMDPTSPLSPDVLFELGLYTDVEHVSGSLSQAQSVDPDRQISLPGQLTMAHGESFDANVFNRAVFQLGVNSDRSDGLLSRRRMALTTEEVVASWVEDGSPPDAGYQFTGSTYVYTGPDVTPTAAQLEELFAILDGNGNELVREVVNSSPNTMSFTVDADTGKQHVTYDTGTAAANVDTGDYYLRSNDGALPAALQGVRMKISERISATEVVIQPIDPTTGDVTTFTAASVAAVLTDLVTTVKARIVEVQESNVSATRVEQVTKAVTTAAVPTRVDLNNRIIADAADFITDGVAEGNLVVWSGHGVADPFTNNGTYRVSKVIDKRTLEVMGEDFGPAFIHSDITSGAAGTFDITTDGEFALNPFIVFENNGAQPTTGEAITIVYQGMSTFRDATADPTVFAKSVRYAQEADAITQAAFLTIFGPSVDSISDYLHGDRRNNLEDLDNRANYEHYGHDEVGPDTSIGHAGRHRDIRPDTIDMFPSLSSGNVATFRNLAGTAMGVVTATGQMAAGSLGVTNLTAENQLRVERAYGATSTSGRVSPVEFIATYSDTASGGSIQNALLVGASFAHTSTAVTPQVEVALITGNFQMTSAAEITAATVLKVEASLGGSATQELDSLTSIAVGISPVPDIVNNATGISIGAITAGKLTNTGLVIGDMTGATTNVAFQTGLGDVIFGDAIGSALAAKITDTYDIGAVGFRWNEGHFARVKIGTLADSVFTDGLTIDDVIANPSGNKALGIRQALEVTTNHSVTGASFSANTSATGAVSTVVGMAGGASVASASAATVGVISGAQISVNITGSLATVTDLYWIRTFGNTTGGSAITNKYGLFLEDVTGASTVNAAIKTGLGLVDFGDTTEITVPALTTATGNLFKVDIDTGKSGIIVMQRDFSSTQYPVVGLGEAPTGDQMLRVNAQGIMTSSGMFFGATGSQLIVSMVGETPTTAAIAVIMGTGTAAAINLGSVAGDPTTVANGDLWYNSSTNKVRIREGGVSKDVA